MKEMNKLKIAVISGVAHAMKYKEMNKNATPDEVIRYISSQVDKIVSKIEEFA